MTKRLARLNKSTDRQDPVTFNDVDIQKAYYIRPDATNGVIKAMYRKSTLDRLVSGGRGTSPLTRKTFFRTDIALVPRSGRVHPDLLGKNMETILSHDDTKAYTWQSLKQGQTATFVTNDDGNTKLKMKKIAPAQDGSRQWEVSLNTTFVIKGHGAMDDLADALAGAFKANKTRVLVMDSRVTAGSSV